MPTDTATPEPANGKPPNGEQKPPQEQSLLESQERARRLVESVMWAQMYDGFGGSDALFDLFQERYGNAGSGYWLPVSVVSDRKRGDNYPIWRNEFELGQYRQRSRIISRKNSYARSLLFNLLTHNIGKGFTYEIQPKENRDAAPESPGVQANPQDTQIVKQTQAFVDKFLMTNRFTASVNPDPDASIVSSSREWESGRRVWRDGETIFRLFFVEDEESELRGMTFVRFVEPEQVTDPPQSGDGTGWSYGMRHQTEPFEDEEDIKEYYVKYKGTRNDGQEGEYVPASEIVHLKNLEEDAATKRGLPAFSLDMVDSLERASKLMRNVSTSSGVRAATAEIWQHEVASEAQVQSLATRLSERQFTNPVSGKTETQERTRPGSTRRIPMGQKPVWPQAVGASEHLEVLQGDLRQCGAVFAAPEYMTGDASNANYSSSKEAGAPFVIASEVTQGHFKTAFMIIVLRAIKWGMKCGLLAENTLDVVELQVTAPTISVRDPLQTAQEDQILIGTKIKSVKTAQGERGLDPDHEAANNEEFDAKFGQQGGALPMPGDGGDPFGGGGGGPSGGPQPSGGDPLAGMLASLESLELMEAGFTGIDSHGHKWSDGKQVARDDLNKPGVQRDAAKDATSPDKIRGYADQLIQKYGDKAKAKIEEAKRKYMDYTTVLGRIEMELEKGDTAQAAAPAANATQKSGSGKPADEQIHQSLDLLKRMPQFQDGLIDIHRAFAQVNHDRQKAGDAPLTLPEFHKQLQGMWDRGEIEMQQVNERPRLGRKGREAENARLQAMLDHGIKRGDDNFNMILKLKGPLRESRDVLENFTGIDAHGHHWQNGKQVAAPKDAPASPDKHVETWASYASKIPAKVMQAAKVKVKGHYDRLEARYGRPTALAIIGAGIAAFPLPGGTIIGPAPIVAVAELVRWFKGKGTPAMESEEATLTPEEIARLGKEFMVAVMADESEPVVESEDFEAFLLESGFTGVLTDRLGHKQHYQDGHHVAGPTAIDVSHASHPKAKDLAEQAVKLWGKDAKAKLEEAIAKHADDADPAAQRKAMAAKVALAGLATHHDIGDFDLGKEFGEPAKEESANQPFKPNKSWFREVANDVRSGKTTIEAVITDFLDGAFDYSTAFPSAKKAADKVYNQVEATADQNGMIGDEHWEDVAEKTFREKYDVAKMIKEELERLASAKDMPKPLPAAPNAAPAPENVVKAKPHEKAEDAATLDAAHEHVKKLFDSALTDDKLFEKVDAAMASISNEMSVPQIKLLAGKFGINDVRGTKSELVDRIGEKIKSRREQHERAKPASETAPKKDGGSEFASADGLAKLHEEAGVLARKISADEKGKDSERFQADWAELQNKVRSALDVLPNGQVKDAAQRVLGVTPRGTLAELKKTILQTIAHRVGSGFRANI